MAKPVVIDLDDAPLVTVSDAAPVPDLGMPEGRGVQAAAGIVTGQRSALGRFAVWALGALAGFMISVAVYDFVTGLLARNSVLGWVAFALAGLAILALLGLALREAAGFYRLGRLDHLRVEVDGARGDLKAAGRAVDKLAALYKGRAELRWGSQRLAERRAEVLDADGLLDLAEVELLTPLDVAARVEIEAAARRVATVTALVPLALADVAVALFANLAMIRKIAVIYGGRSGMLGSWRLLRRVFSHLLATGALALGDDLIGSVAGGGVLSKLSRRFGEGVVNGALTARVGVAAMELCRPMPFVALPRPKVSNVMRRALTGVFDGFGAGKDG
ncbi:putative membrane protein [Pseudorhodobacter antarcticus]|jgi:putative membrane protein|uniref:Putative membrane protein n=1 Tax=Pseudorhodobacter antarcticus TaxID=1077947 RepID=A0A1H8IW13_9RHOB|nr:TIGR01620 family protein [Pseudorhodobacter antarcticus]SEN72662.1 putative membrane protein [Pseudorhodobacter antarcticus]